MGKAINRVGEIHSFLKVLEQKREGRHTYLYCECFRCGNKKWIRSDSVVSGKQISCGCYREEETLIEANNIRGKLFNYLRAIEPTEKKDINNGAVIWIFECICNNRKEISGADVVSGKIQSCGCKRSENGKKNGKINAKKMVEYDKKHIYIANTNIAKLGSEKPVTNTSGYKGVTFDNHTGKWKAGIIFQKKYYYLGRHYNIEDAAAARNNAEKELKDGFLDWYAKEYPERWDRMNKNKVI